MPQEKLQKWKKYLNIGISNWYNTIISRYCPLSMPIFESPSRSQGLLFNLQNMVFKYDDNNNMPPLKNAALLLENDVGHKYSENAIYLYLFTYEIVAFNYVNT